MVYNWELFVHRVKLFHSMTNLFFPLAKLFCHSFLKWLNQFTLPLTMYEHSSCSTPSPTLSNFGLFNFRHYDKWCWYMILCYSLNLHFLNDQRRWALFSYIYGSLSFILTNRKWVDILYLHFPKSITLYFGRIWYLGKFNSFIFTLWK